MVLFEHSGPDLGTRRGEPQPARRGMPAHVGGQLDGRRPAEHREVEDHRRRDVAHEDREVLVGLEALRTDPPAHERLTGLAPDGTLLLCGYDATPLTLPFQPMVLNRLHVMASPSGSPHDLRDTLAFSARHGILPRVTPIGLDEAPAALDRSASVIASSLPGGGPGCGGADAAALAEQGGLTIVKTRLKPDGEQLAEIAALAEAGALRPVVSRSLPLDAVAEAHRLSQDGHIVGKIVLTTTA